MLVGLLYAYLIIISVRRSLVTIMPISVFMRLSTLKAALHIALCLSVYLSVPYTRTRHSRWYCCGLIVCSESLTIMSDEKRLIRSLLREYKKVGVVGRPVFNQSDTIKVRYGLTLIQILEMDEKNQVLTTNVWSRYVSYLYHSSIRPRPRPMA